MRILALVAAAILIGGCGLPGPGGSVDGWDLGAAIDCCDDACAETFAVAIEGLDRTVPGHAPIVEKGAYLLRAPIAHGAGSVVVFRLLDGSTRAIGVGGVGLGAPGPWDAPDHPLDPGGRPPAIDY